MKIARLALLPICLLGLTACDTVRDTLGLEHNGPNEFDVATSAPLSMPPDYNLRPPEPGAPRPQEVPANIQAQQTLLGTPITTKSGASVNSGGESALLQQAGSKTAAVTSAELPQQPANPQQERLEKSLFGTPTPGTAAQPTIEMESRGGWFNWL